MFVWNDDSEANRVFKSINIATMKPSKISHLSYVDITGPLLVFGYIF